MDETTVSYKILRVEGDPVSWVIECADADALARQLGPSSPPVAVTAVCASGRHAGAVAAARGQHRSDDAAALRRLDA